MPIFEFKCKNSKCSKNGQVFEKILPRYEDRYPCPVCKEIAFAQITAWGGIEWKNGHWNK